MDTATIALLVAGFFFALLIVREVVCWYWKVNEHIALQKETNRLLAKIAGEPVEVDATSVPPSTSRPQ